MIWEGAVIDYIDHRYVNFLSASIICPSHISGARGSIPDYEEDY